MDLHYNILLRNFWACLHYQFQGTAYTQQAGLLTVYTEQEVCLH